MPLAPERIGEGGEGGGGVGDRGCSFGGGGGGGGGGLYWNHIRPFVRRFRLDSMIIASEPQSLYCMQADLGFLI